MNARNTGVALTALAALLWATTGAAATLAPNVGSLAVGAAAMGIGGLLQAVFAGRQIRRHLGLLRSRWVLVTLSAVAVAVYPLAFYSSMRLAGVAVGTVVSIGTAPVAAALLERAIDGTPLTGRWTIGTTVGIFGVAALATAHSGPDAAAPLLGVALGVVAGLTYATYSWGAARLMADGVTSRAAMGSVFGLGGLLLLPVIVLSGGPILASGGNLAVITYLAVIPMFVGYLLFGQGLARISAGTATTVTLIEPAVAALIAVTLLGEHLPVVGWVGVGLLFGSLAVTAAGPAPVAAPGRVHPSLVPTRTP